MRVALLALVLAMPAPADAEQLPLDSAPAVAAGLGAEYARAGVQALYYQRVSALPLAIVPRASIGYFPVEGGGTLGLSAGLGAALGRRHRLVADAGWGVVGVETLALHGTRVDQRRSYGMIAGVGYEMLTASGLFVRLVPLGLVRPFDDRLPGELRTVRFRPSAGIGWKVW